MTVRWGVLGSGGIARRRTIPEGMTQAAGGRLAAVYDVNAEANRAVASQFDAAACATEEELLGRSDVDAVYVATPAHLHARQSAAAARAGKHVFCEKPLGLTVAEAQSVVDACRAAGVVLGVDFMMRFHAFHREARRLVEQGALGRMVLGRAQLSCWYPPMPGAWRQDPATGGGGSLIDMGGHCIDLLETFLGRVRSVMCMTGNLVHAYESSPLSPGGRGVGGEGDIAAGAETRRAISSDSAAGLRTRRAMVEDTAVVLAEFESGAVGTIDACFNIPDAASRNRLELYGSRGSILAEGTIGQGEGGEMIVRVEDAAGYQASQSRDLAGGVRVDVPTVNLYKAQMEDVNAAIAAGRPPLCDGAAGLWSQKVLAACYASARQRKAVRL